VPLTFEVTYFFTQQQTGLVLLATVVGAVVGNICYPLQECLYHKYANKIPDARLLRRLRGGQSPGKATTEWNPEARLYTACFLSITMSIGMFTYAIHPSRATLSGPQQPAHLELTQLTLRLVATGLSCGPTSHGLLRASQSPLLHSGLTPSTSPCSPILQTCEPHRS
jgi:hypothetical protein